MNEEIKTKNIMKVKRMVIYDLICMPYMRQRMMLKCLLNSNANADAFCSSCIVLISFHRLFGVHA